MTTPLFEGIWLPIITPFTAERVDYPALTRLAQQLCDQGIHGLIIGATTGEGACLSTDERLQMLASLRQALPETPIVIGLNGMETLGTAAQARELAQAKPQGLLVTAPPYVRPGQTGIRRHFETIAAAADLPILIYDIPYRCGTEIGLDTLQALSRDPRIVGIKTCGASVDRLMRLIHETTLKVLIGEDSQFFAALCLGAHGAIAASAHFRPELWVRIFDLLREQRLDEARHYAALLQPMVRALFAEPNPAPIKAWLAAQGWINNALRLPFVPASETCLAEIGRIARLIP